MELIEQMHALFAPKRWERISDEYPKDNTLVYTCIQDENGNKRNEQILKRHSNLWWQPDGKVYVYYTPTHFKEL